MLNGSEVVLNFVAGKKNSELLVDELSSVVSHRGIRYPETGENVPPNELLSLAAMMVDSGSASTNFVK